MERSYERKSGEQHSAAASLTRVPENRFFDLLWIDASALHGGLRGDDSHVSRRHRAEGAAEFSNRGANGRQNVCVLQQSPPNLLVYGNAQNPSRGALECRHLDELLGPRASGVFHVSEFADRVSRVPRIRLGQTVHGERRLPRRDCDAGSDARTFRSVEISSRLVSDGDVHRVLRGGFPSIVRDSATSGRIIFF